VCDDVSALTAIVLRQDATLTEVRAAHSQHGHLAKRVRDLKTPGEGNSS
jgi:hypothetical protein